MAESYVLCYGPTLAQYVACQRELAAHILIDTMDGGYGPLLQQVRGLAIPVRWWRSFWETFERICQYNTSWDTALFAVAFMLPTAVRFVRALGGGGQGEQLSIAGIAGRWMRSSPILHFDLPTVSLKGHLDIVDWPSHVHGEAQVRGRSRFSTEQTR